jgi:D-alanyl-D-alanine carboxypeptidase/D-alanyl-D-alanine-endopeptidase (penicillin-binding protein 4)
MNARRLFSLPIALIAFSCSAHGESEINLQALLKNGSARVERQDGTPLLRYRDDEKFVPASTLKVATSFCALEKLGGEYRFQTLFFSDGQDTLFIRSSGDPSLVSETLKSIASQLATRLSSINRVIIDTSLFSDDIEIDGSERSLNPYDAKNAAFVGNFSSANLTRTKSGAVVSAERQTPLTPLARQAGLKLSKGHTERVNLSSNWRTGVQYGGELLAEFLKQSGARGSMLISRGSIPSSAKVIYTHNSPQNLNGIIQAMLKYSTNFTANQIFLTLGVAEFGAPATVSKGQRAMRACLERLVGWRDFHVEEGSGLSRKNQVSATQMNQLLNKFDRYSWLLPEQDGFIAKTGSLRGVNSLVGYFSPSGQLGRVRFSILINSEVPHLYKFRVANELRDYIKNRDR